MMETVRQKRALIVDDLTDNRIAIGRLLVDFGISVVQARTGFEAVKIYEEDPSFDLVVMDIDMPGLNGFATARLIRQYQMAKRPWIVGLASDADYGTKASQAGIDLFVSKSIVTKAVEGGKNIPTAFTLIQGGGGR